MLDISLVVIGFIIVAISYFISEKVEVGNNSNLPEDQAGKVHEIWSEKDEEKVRTRVEAVISRKMNEMVDKADDELSTISNEKIMAMDEFSNQLLEKIETNHKEVVFLYNMLNTKQDEIKKMVTDIDSSKSALEDLVRMSKERAEKPFTGIDMLQRIAKDKGQEENQEKLEDTETSATLSVEPKEEKRLSEGKEKKSNKQIPAKKTEKSDLLKEKVLNLHQEGKSILEISKILHIGQGEVKLIIDLYQGATV